MRRRSQQDVARAAQKAGMARSTPVTGIQSRTAAEYDSLILQALGDLYERNATARPTPPRPPRGQQIDTIAHVRPGRHAAQLEQHRLDALYQQAIQT